MKRIALTMAGALLAGTAMSMAGTAHAGSHEKGEMMAEVEGPKVVWRYSMWGKPRAFTENLEYMSEGLARLTGGNFELKLFYGEQLSKGKENLDGLSLGSFDAASFCASYHPGKNAPLNVLDMPFLPLTDYDVQKAVHTAVFEHPASQKALKRWNAKLFMSQMLPQYEFMGRGKAPETIEDFDGMRVRALGGLAKAMEKLGGVPTTVTASETYTGLQRGTIDAISFPFTYTFVSYKINEISEWYTSNLKFGTVACPMAINQASWNKLPAQYKALMVGMRDMAYEALVQAYGEKDAVNLPLFQKTLKEVTFTEAELDKFRKIGGKPVWDEWIAENKDKVPAQELFDLVMSTAKKTMEMKK